MKTTHLWTSTLTTWSPPPHPGAPLSFWREEPGWVERKEGTVTLAGDKGHSAAAKAQSSDALPKQKRRQWLQVLGRQWWARLWSPLSGQSRLDKKRRVWACLVLRWHTRHPTIHTADFTTFTGFSYKQQHAGLCINCYFRVYEQLHTMKKTK